VAVTIVDVAQASETELEKGILMQVLRCSDLIGLVPWVTKNTLRVQGTRAQTLPETDFRQYNAGYSEDTGTLEQWSDGLFPLGGDIYIEKQFENLQETLENPSVTQARMKLKSIAMTFNHYFVNGTPALGGFTGLRHRIMTVLPARQRINLASAAGDSLKVLANAASTHDLVDAMHQAAKVLGGKASAYLMNENTYLRVSAALRRQGLLDTSRDIFDREVKWFNGAQLVDVGLQRDQATAIIADTEDPGDGGNDATSMYAVRFGPAGTDDTITEGDGLYGIQKNKLFAYDPLNGAEMEARPAFIRRIDWPVTLSTMGDNYAVARIYGFRMAAT
jgi:hypothetical protein